MDVIAEIAAERRRQVEVEGWSLDHDDEHTDGSLAGAAAAYALLSTVTDRADLAVLEQHGADGMTYEMKAAWPKSWDTSWFKPKGRRRDLVRAAALIVAEIERLDRAQ
jgi:hypothetical protein